MQHLWPDYFTMNIFVLHEDPDESSKAHCDKHVNKMTLEAVQIANTALHLSGADDLAFYDKTHTSHPWCEFAAKSFNHFSFVVRRAEALGREFLRRYGSRHTSHEKIAQNWTERDMRQIEQTLGTADSEQVWNDIPQAMPESYYDKSPVHAYRKYYCFEKAPKQWFKFDRVRPPEWFTQLSPIYRWLA